MKIQCNVCEVAEANVFCCADEAALCRACDEKVHVANKLASKHQRVSLSGSSSQMPKCDICQEIVGYFFCLEDRALLCRKCDVAIHTANALVSAHQRFLLTGVIVGVEPIEPGASLSSGKSRSDEKFSGTQSLSLSKIGVPTSLAGQCNDVLPNKGGGVSYFLTTKLSPAGGSADGSFQQWQMDEFLGLSELNQNYGYMDNGSSKADGGKLGYSHWSPILRAAEVELDDGDILGQVPEASWAVPQLPTPPTVSGLFWPKNYDLQIDTAAFVPDICCTSMEDPSHCEPSGPSLKRRRQF